ncbi:hypothetical protein O53_3566 [Microcystis aeruginosa TAIHU98]|uniref:Uncharacterized protein n=1 Tax=Microcystis aeruginosa TAIHU98 TaxID=1134457 RepID=L7E7A0_MICAE|nr:hypothetical protein O53_3566 [Microcystis aeruginosa TAIHU98]
MGDGGVGEHRRINESFLLTPDSFLLSNKLCFLTGELK